MAKASGRLGGMSHRTQMASSAKESPQPTRERNIMSTSWNRNRSLKKAMEKRSPYAGLRKMKE